MIRSARIFAIAMALLICTAALAHAKTVTVHAGFSAWVPDSWSTKQSSKFLTETNAPGGTPYVSFEVPSKSVSLKSASESYGRELGKSLSNLHFGKTNHATINGMECELIDGSGTRNGNTVKFTYAAYQSGSRYLIAFAAAPASVYDGKVDLLVKILRSVSR